MTTDMIDGPAPKHVDVFKTLSSGQFNDIALELFHYQYKKNAIYRKFVDCLGVAPDSIKSLEKIPFLPVGFFRDQVVLCGKVEDTDIIFRSSGTTGTVPSHHYVKELSLYEESFSRGFRYFYGPPEDFYFLALLPSYLEHSHSSLIFMMDSFIRKSGKESGFYLHDYDSLVGTLNKLKGRKKKIILWGVSFALMELAENFKLHIPEVIVMETGGMKGRRKEITRDELHQELCARFDVQSIHSEYGMTELLSQSYSAGAGRFITPPWMKVLIRDVNDPLSLIGTGKTGGINVIDLANIHSCAFIATQDLGKIHSDNSFEVLGRFDDSDVRGCSLLF